MPWPRWSTTTTPPCSAPPRRWATCARRQVNDPEAIEVFRLGHANRTLSYRLPTKERKDGAELRGRLQRLGVFRASGHEHLNGCVVVPIIDSSVPSSRSTAASSTGTPAPASPPTSTCRARTGGSGTRKASPVAK